MAEPSVSSRVGVEIKPTPETQVPGVSIAPARVKPSAVAAFADQVVPMFSALSERAMKEEGKRTTYDLLIDWSTENQTQFEGKKTEGSWTRPDYIKWRGERRLEIQRRAAKEGLDQDSFKELLTMADKSLDQEFFLDRVRRVNVDGGQVTNLVDDDIQFGEMFDADALLAARWATLSKAYPVSANMWATMAVGRNSDGTPAANPDIQRRVGEELTFNAAQREERVERDILDTRTILKALERDQASQSRVVFEQGKIRSFIGNGFREGAADVLRGMLYEDDGKWRKMPPKAAQAEFRSRLISLRSGHTYQVWEAEANDTDYLTKQIDALIPMADAMFEGLNKLNMDKYTVEQQSAIMDMIANKAIIDMGPTAIATFKNAENMLQLAQSAIAMSMAEQKGIGDQNPIGAFMRTFQSQADVATVRGQLIEIDSKQPSAMVPYISRLADTLDSQIAGIFSNDPAAAKATPFSVYTMIQDIKQSSGVNRWLEDMTVPAEDRQNFLRLLNYYEDELLKKGKFNPDTLDDAYRKKWQPGQSFVNGFVPIAEKPLKPSEAPKLAPEE